MKMHADQLTVTPATVRALVDEQFPAWRGLPIRAVGGTGTVHAIFRIGDRLAARLPLVLRPVEAARQALLDEADAARKLLGRTPFPTPEPIALGVPGAGYPMPWSVQTWVSGTVAAVADPGDSVEFALDLAEFIRAVREIGTDGRGFGGGGRGGELHAHDEWMRTCFERSAGMLNVAALRAIWARMRDLPRGAAPDVLNHGDLIPGNVLVSGGRLAGVIDVGELGPADPALDLVAAWHLLDAVPRSAFRAHLGCSDLEWERGRAWAFEQAMGLVWYYAESNPALSRIGLRTLERITEC